MSLLTTTVKNINWLTRQLVSKAQMNNFQTWLQMWGAVAAQQTGLQGVIISGLAATAVNGTPSGAQFDCAVGFGTDETGKPLIVNDPLSLLVTGTNATTVKCYLTLKFKGTDTDNTVTPAESGNLYTEYGAELELVKGTNTTYPTLTNKGLILLGCVLNTDGSVASVDRSVASLPTVGIKGDSRWTNALTNPTEIPAGQQLTHYEMSLAANLTVDGTLITGNLVTTGYTLDSTGGKVVVLY